MILLGLELRPVYMGEIEAMLFWNSLEFFPKSEKDSYIKGRVISCPLVHPTSSSQFHLPLGKDSQNFKKNDGSLREVWDL